MRVYVRQARQVGQGLGPWWNVPVFPPPCGHNFAAGARERRILVPDPRGNAVAVNQGLRSHTAVGYMSALALRRLTGALGPLQGRTPHNIAGSIPIGGPTLRVPSLMPCRAGGGTEKSVTIFITNSVTVLKRRRSHTTNGARGNPARYANRRALIGWHGFGGALG